MSLCVLTLCVCSILFRAVWRGGAAGKVVIIVKHNLTSTIEIGRGRTVNLRWLLAYISWWCRRWGIINIPCRLLCDLVCRTCRCIMSKLSRTVIIVPVSTSAMTVIVISTLYAVRTKHTIGGSGIIIIKTAPIDHWLVRLHPDILEWAHHCRVGLLQFLQHFHAVLGLLELAWQLVDSLEDHDAEGLGLDNGDYLLEHVVTELMEN